MGGYKSFLEPNTCGFYRTAAFLVINKEEKGDDENQPHRTLGERYDQYCSIFEDIEYKLFMSSTNRLKNVIQKWGKSKKDERDSYISTFHPKIYNSLPHNIKVGHTLQNCKGCKDVNFLEMQSRFPVSLKAVKHLKASKENPFNAAKMKMKISAGTCINDCTRQIYTIVNQPFEKTFGISFAEGLTAMKEVNLVKKRSAYE